MQCSASPRLPGSYGTSPISFQSSSSSQRYVSSHVDKIPCPFNNFDGCRGGTNGRGYAKSAIRRHLHDQHFPSESDKELCRDRIRTNSECFTAWEEVLEDMQM